MRTPSLLNAPITLGDIIIAGLAAVVIYQYATREERPAAAALPMFPPRTPEALIRQLGQDRVPTAAEELAGRTAAPAPRKRVER